MPTKKPIVQIVLTNEYNEKLKQLASEQGRSTSNLGARIIEQYIDNYEAEHGGTSSISSNGTSPSN
jgi:predicted DNA-binding protein